MRLPACLVILASAAAVVPAHAETPFPTTDFSGTWVLQDERGNEFRAQMNYSASSRAMRIQAAPGGMEINVIRDMDSGDTVMWTSQMPGMGMRVETPTDIAADAKPTGAVQSVNGETCKVWRIAQGTACLGDGNVPLKTEVKGNEAELRDVKRGPQDASLFEPPVGLSIMDVKNVAGMMEGLSLPALPF